MHHQIELLQRVDCCETEVARGEQLVNGDELAIYVEIICVSEVHAGETEASKHSSKA